MIMRWIAAALLILCCSALYAQDELQREFKTSPGKRLEVDLKTGGSVRVTGCSGWKSSVGGT